MVTELIESDIPSPKTPIDSKKTLTQLDSIAGDTTPKQETIHHSSTEKDVASPNNSKETNPLVEENKVRKISSFLAR